ncbi:MAG: hypothetical protein LBT40_00380 [Deltaproteobacteria bacterium]|jgi:hypothetical protein|nr:hypothetical protein [Deltaproteobacteria bacterium]
MSKNALFPLAASVITLALSSVLCQAQVPEWTTFNATGNPIARGLSFSVNHPVGFATDFYAPGSREAGKGIIANFIANDRRTQFQSYLVISVRSLGSMGVSPDDFGFGKAWIAWMKIAGSGTYDSFVLQGRPAADIFIVKREDATFSSSIIRYAIDGSSAVELACIIDGEKMVARRERIAYWEKRSFNSICKPFTDSLSFAN